MFEFHRLHHLSQHTVPENDYRNQVFIGKIKSFMREVGKFLYSEYPVTSAPPSENPPAA